jgi:hypothetical protein
VAHYYTPETDARRPSPRAVLTSMALVLCVAAPAAAQEAPGDDALREALVEIAGQVVYPERCAECHASEFEVWEQTAHATGFDTLHTTDRAKEVYRALGLRLIKRGTEETTPACLECHYTPEVRRDTVRAAAGVTCESCHGPARDWVGVHNSYGVAESDFQQAARLETPEHRDQRIADSRAAGMRRPSDLYGVAANCFGCHTVPKENLVNVGGHTTGSDIELVDWIEQIRHNFLESYKTADGRTNAVRPAERQRVMYVLGRALDVEYSVRGVAAATQDELYFAAMSDRAGAAIDELYYLNETVAIPAVQTIIEQFDQVELKPNNAAALLAVADAIQAATRSFVSGTDGSRLAALDPLWNPDVALSDRASSPTPSGSARVARVTELALPAAAVDAPGADSADRSVARVEPASEDMPPPEATGAATESAPTASVPEHAIYARPPWRAAPDHPFVKVPCGKCHTQQQGWWQKDTHKGTADPLRNGDPEAVQIATRYGIDPGDMAKGDQICMWCHGTIVSAPTRKVRPGVGCQRCHGAGGDYLGPHETESYAQSLDRGLADLKSPAVRVQTCAGCHYITDPGLLAAGHASGDEFDVVDRMGEIRHWGTDFGRDTDDPITAAALTAAHRAVISERGPPPVVELIQDPTPVVPNRSASATGFGSGRLAAVATAPGSTVNAGRGGPVTSRAAVPDGGVELSPRARERSPRTFVPASTLPAVSDPGLSEQQPRSGASFEELLLQLKTRLEQLYRAVGREAAP